MRPIPNNGDLDGGGQQSYWMMGAPIELVSETVAKQRCAEMVDTAAGAAADRALENE